MMPDVDPGDFMLRMLDEAYALEEGGEKKNQQQNAISLSLSSGPSSSMISRNKSARIEVDGIVGTSETTTAIEVESDDKDEFEFGVASSASATKNKGKIKRRSVIDDDEDDDDEENTKLMIEQCSENGDGYSAIVSIAANPLDFCVKCYENDDHNDLDSSSPAIFDIHDLSVVNDSQVNDDKTDLIYSQLQPQSTLPTLETYALSAWSQNHCGEEAGSLKPTQIRATQIDSQLSQTQPTQEMETAEYN